MEEIEFFNDGVVGYENIYVQCSHCKKENIYNKIDDLPQKDHKKFKNGGMNLDAQNILQCFFCKKEFIATRINVFEPYEFKWFLRGLPKLKQQKNYMLYILHLCQACEIFFTDALMVNISQNNGNFDKFDKEIEKLSFGGLRKKFLGAFENNESITNKTLKNSTINAFETIKTSNIGSMRNKVVHKFAYRPSLSDIEQYDSLIASLYELCEPLDFYTPKKTIV